MAASQSLTRNIDRELAFTDEALDRDVKHIQFQHSPAGFVFLAEAMNPEDGGAPLQGAGKRTQVGGQKVQINHAVEGNSTVRRMTGAWDTYDTTPQDFVRRSEASWAHASGTRVLSLTDELINTGPAAIADIQTEETFNVMGSLVEQEAEDVYSGSGTGMTGLDSLIGANDTVQGLSGATYGRWNSRGVSARGTAAASVSFAGGAFSATGITNWRIAYNNSSEGMRQPGLMLTDWAVHQYYEAALTPQERYSAPASTGDAGFTSLQFKRAPVIADSLATSGVTYFLNLDVVYAKVLAGADFAFQPWVHAQNQETRASELVFKGQMCVEDRRLVNKVTSQTA